MRRFKVPPLLVLCAAIAFTVAAALLANGAAMRAGLERLGDAARHRLDMITAQLDGEQARFGYLPSLLEMSPSVFELLKTPDNAPLRDEVNRYLQGINATAGADTLYVLDGNGRGVAASDWNEFSTPIGVDLSFRPYVQDALTLGHGRFYGVGVTSKRAGFYLAYALLQDGKQRGVATVKVDLEDMERGWRKFPGDVLVVDERGVIILSSREEWKFRPLQPLAPQVLAEIARTRPYGDADLKPMAWKVGERPAGDASLVSVDGHGYLVTARPANAKQWQLLVVDDTTPVKTDARHSWEVAALSMMLVWMLGAMLWQRQRAVRQKLASRAALQQAHDSLETKVELRTAELLGANAKLADEVEARKAIETDLRETQSELVHAGKMAALGQMSAGMVHELNQPLGALRTLSDNACVLLDKERIDDARGNLQRIAHLVDRLGRLTYQLKAFAHKTEAPRVPVAIQTVVNNANFLVSHRLRANGVELDVQIEPPELAVLAEEARLEQVLANLMGNASDAMASSPVRRLRVEGSAADGQCRIAVSDTGPGIREDVLPRLFEPFTTTKPAGEGLGLGLMISAHIVREFGGTLKAFNLDTGGACFVIEMPLATTPPSPRRNSN
ncbi:ATP-binding protein [Variovorax humicola]|uniref:histidine kinase n=1 Tax=Variovorax humicola TaxID=1769758 RepID=A0ABU8VVD4_9BURK